MIKNYQYKIPFQLAESLDIILDCVKEVPQWNLVILEEQAGVVEWKQKVWPRLGVTKIRAYLREPRPRDTLVTLYINRPFMLADPFKTCDRTFETLEAKLNDKINTLKECR